MKPILWFSALLVMASGAMAQTGASREAAVPKSSQKRAVSPARASAKDVQELRDALAAQQKQSEEQRQQLEQLKSQLQQLLDATQQANATAQKVQGSAEQAQATAAQAQQSAADAQRQADQVSSSVTEAKTALALVDKQSQDENKKISALQDVLGRFRFSGDIRVRGEDILSGLLDLLHSQSRPHSRPIRCGWSPERKLRGRSRSGHRLTGRPDFGQRNLHQLLRAEDHRSRPRIYYLQSGRGQVALPHRW